MIAATAVCALLFMNSAWYLSQNVNMDIGWALVVVTKGSRSGVMAQ